MSPEKLRSLTKKELVELARNRQVSGWHGMRKQELIDALAQKRMARRTRVNGESGRRSPEKRGGVRPRVNRSRKSSVTSNRRESRTKTSMTRDRQLVGASTAQSDVFRVEVLDAHWLHLSWELRQETIDRAQASLGMNWFAARSVLRILDVTPDDSRGSVKVVIDDVEINGAARHWFLPVPHPGRMYRFQLGFLTSEGTFHAVARSKRIQTHPATEANRNSSVAEGRPSQIGQGFTARQSQQQIPHLKSPVVTSVSQAAESDSRQNESSRSFPLSIHAEATISGKTVPGAEVMILDDVIPVESDGSFAVRVTVPEGRQVLPTVAVAPDGSEIRTIVLALERNTKELEPQVKDDLNGF